MKEAVGELTKGLAERSQMRTAAAKACRCCWPPEMVDLPLMAVATIRIRTFPPNRESALGLGESAFLARKALKTKARPLPSACLAKLARKRPARRGFFD
jgi:hypothetical protein